MAAHNSQFTLTVVSLAETGTDIGQAAITRLGETLTRHYETVYQRQCGRITAFDLTKYTEVFRHDVASVYPRLIWLAQQDTDLGINYRELEPLLKGPVGSRAMYTGYVIGTISRLEALEDRPALSTLVVNKKLGHPDEDHRYFEMLDDLGRTANGDDAHTQWYREYDRVKAEWTPLCSDADTN